MFLLFIFSKSVELNFNFEDLVSNSWNILLTSFSGIYGKEHNQFLFKEKMGILKENGNMQIELKSTYFKNQEAVFQINASSPSFEVYDINKTLIATITSTPIETRTVFLRGSTNDYLISGILSPDTQSMIVMTSKHNDSTLMIRLDEREPVRTGSIMGRLLPSFFILITFGFGRVYRKRFWKQFNTMNTGTLNRRIREAKKDQPKAD